MAWLSGEEETVKALLNRPNPDPNRAWQDYVRADWFAQAAPGQRLSEVEELVAWLCVCYQLWLQQHG